MILDKTVKIKIINNRVRNYYSDLGYDTKNYQIDVSIEHLLKNSHVIVNVKCDICQNQKKLKFVKYNKNISKHNIYTCSNSCAQIKNRMTSIEKFGVEHHSKTNEHRLLVSKCNIGKDSNKYEFRDCIICKNSFEVRKLYNKITCSKECLKILQKDSIYKMEIFKKTQDSLLKKYGVTNQYQRNDIIDKLRKIRIERGLEVPEDQLSNWKRYKRIVRKLTIRNKKVLFETWSGFDFYDNEFIRNNFNLKHTDKNYPTIDHKVSVLYGFKNGIEPEEISKLDNLCITKRILNIIKGSKCYNS